MTTRNTTTISQVMLFIVALVVAAPSLRAQMAVCQDQNTALPTIVAACTKVVAMGDQNIAKAYYHRAYAQMILQKKKEALADVTTAIKIDPELAIAFNFRAGLHYKMGNLVQAYTDLTEAVRLEPRSNMYARFRRKVVKEGKNELAHIPGVPKYEMYFYARKCPGNKYSCIRVIGDGANIRTHCKRAGQVITLESDSTAHWCAKCAQTRKAGRMTNNDCQTGMKPVKLLYDSEKQARALMKD